MLQFGRRRTLLRRCDRLWRCSDFRLGCRSHHRCESVDEFDGDGTSFAPVENLELIAAGHAPTADHN